MYHSLSLEDKTRSPFYSFIDLIPSSEPSSVISDVELKSQIEQPIFDDHVIGVIQPKKERQVRIYKNLLVLCVAFLLQFTGFGAIGTLQSSLNTEANVGVNSQSIIYGFLILSSIFLPHPLIALFGLKWTLVICQIPYLLYVAANYYPKAYLMYPAAALVGLAAAPLWTAKCTYLTDTATIYAGVKHVHKDVIVNRFFGIFFMFFNQVCLIWGNLISYFVLKPEEIQLNGTSSKELAKYDKCGAEFSEEEYKGAEVVNQIERKTIDILCIIYICISVCSILTVVFLLNQQRKPSRNRVPVMLYDSVELLISTIKHMKNVNQLLLIPLSIWLGLEQSFLVAQFTKGFVSCTLNAKYVGLVLLPYSICDSIGSLSFGQLAKYVGRWPCSVVAAVINYTLIVTMFLWKPSEDQIAVLLVIAGLWGLADAVWQTQINAFYGIVFVENHEAAFSNFRLWESAGFILFYIITPYARIRIALTILLIFLSLGMLGYSLTEYRWKVETKRAQIVLS